LVTNDEEDTPFQPLNDVIVKFKRRRSVMSWLMLLALPSTVFGIVLFVAFALVSRFSIVALVTFSFLAFSAIVSYVAILYVPGELTGVIRSLELTIREISFATMPPIGETPTERILNQLIRTENCLRAVIRKNPRSVQLNTHVKGKSGADHVFDVYVHNEDSLARLTGGKTDMNIFVKRFAEVEPLSVTIVRNVKEEVQDCLSRVGRKLPTRVIVTSTDGFEDTVFKYVRTKEGSFGSKYMALRRRIELVKEKTDGSYDVQSF
jgi:hypothetical protein